jgi:polysaccharide export outer membrane protein
MIRMNTSRLVGWCFLVLLGTTWTMAATEQKHKELIAYIQNAQKLGVKDGDIKLNALKAGWDKGSVDEAFTIVNHLNGTAKNSSDITNPAANQGQRLTPAAEAKVETAVPEGYRIGAGDVIGIGVWKEPDASVAEAVVRADGKITMPLIKEVEVVGLTPTELEKKLTEKLSELINGADVTVVVRQITSRKAYLIGAVKKEGPILLHGPLTVMQAISEAGGLTDYAKPSKIYVLRTQNGKQVRLPFDYKAAIRGERPEQNIQILPGDSIVVPH